MRRAMRVAGRTLLPALVCAVWGCADEPPALDEGDELPIGDVSADDLKADGAWGAATTCKPVPELPRLVDPRITISLNGLTLHLVDPATGYDKVFPIGPGAIDGDETSLTYGESLSMYPLLAYDKQDFQITPSSIQPCKIWWTDPATGQKLPVFAGLPFLSWSGSYGIHGPIDNYRSPAGGTLRRGYVSHGCIRMQAADVLELYGRIKGLPRVPVRVQREPERLSDGTRVDVPQKWVGAECDSDDECAYTNGFCKRNAWSDRGFCSARCNRSCADRAGYPTTFCVDDPDDPSLGMCVPKEQAEDRGCRPYDHFVVGTEPRHTQPSVTARVCVPGSPGWVGDRCVSDGDCLFGTSCEAGICTMSCDRYCADEPGWASTFCVSDPSLGAGGRCVRQCTPESNASECAAGQICVERSRNGQPSVVRDVCLPE
jgi:hypothetical protein